jgi:hypothetical protein
MRLKPMWHGGLSQEARGEPAANVGERFEKRGPASGLFGQVTGEVSRFDTLKF